MNETATTDNHRTAQFIFAALVLLVAIWLTIEYATVPAFGTGFAAGAGFIAGVTLLARLLTGEGW